MIIYDPIITGSFQLNGNTLNSVGEIDTLSGSVSALNSASSSYLLNTTDTLTGNLTVTGTLTAQEFHTEYTSASIVYQSGSTKFGDTTDDVHQFTGSALITGNVGIGTAGPNATLEVAKGSEGQYLVVGGDNASNGRALTFTSSTATSNGALHTINASSANGVLAFSTAGNEAMRINSSGNVGIGTNDPTAPFDVRGGSRIWHGSGYGYTAFVAGNETNFYLADGTASQMHLNWNAGSVNIAKNTIIATGDSGRVGIGVSPEAGSKLHIKDTTADAKVTIETSDSYDSFINFSAASNEYSIGFDKGSNSFRIANANTLTSNVHVTVDATGVGINQTSPGDKLDVGGSFRVNHKDTYSQGMKNEFISTYLTRTSFGRVGTSSTLDIDYDIYGTEAATIRRNYANADLLFKVGSTTHMALYRDGNVGIGTTGPSDNLQVYGSSSIIRVTSTSAGANSNVHFETTARRWGIGANMALGSSDFEIYDYTAGSNRLTINSNGDVGIGNTSPGYKLDVQGSMLATSSVRLATSTDAGVTIGDQHQSSVSSSDTKLTLKGKNLEAGGTYYGDYGQLLFWASSNYTGSSRKWLITNGLDANKFAIIRGDTGQVTPTIGTAGGITGGDAPFVIKDDANIGIGNINPEEKLHVNGNVKITNNGAAHLILDGDNNNSGDTGETDSIIDFMHDNEQYGYRMSVQNNAGAQTFKLANNNLGTYTNRLFIENGGSLLLGGHAENENTSATANGWTFTINGTATGVCNFSDANEMVVLNQRDGLGTTQFEFRNGNVERGRIEWTTSGTTYNTTSDYRLKENVVQLTGSLDKVSSLEPKQFNFISNPEDIRVGFLAHEVQEIIPQAVSGDKDAVREDGTPKYQALDHSMLVPVLVGAIKELKAEIDSLKAQLNG